MKPRLKWQQVNGRGSSSNNNNIEDNNYEDKERQVHHFGGLSTRVGAEAEAEAEAGAKIGKRLSGICASKEET